jgi:hypothetical protein
MRDGRLDPGIFVAAAVNRRFDVVVLPYELPAREIPGMGEEFHEALGIQYVEVLQGSYRYLVPRASGAMGP